MIIRRIVRFTAKNSIVPILSILIKKSKFHIAIVPIDRLGHLAMNTHLFFIREKIGSLEHLNYLLITPSKKSSKVANASLLHMFIEYSKNIKNIHFLCSTSVYFFFNFFRLEFSNFKVIYDFPMKSRESEFALGIKTIDFSEKQKKYGESLLKKMPIFQNKKIVTIFARDSSFLHNKFPKQNLSYHSYRDGNIDSYIKAAEEMASRGYYVIRMGVEVNKPMQSQNPKIIDYATIGARGDFMDIYLGAKCTFCISTSSGFDSIPTIFRKPIAFVTVPVAYIYTFSEKFLSITKHHMSKIDNHELSLNEIFDNNVAYAMTSKEFEDNEVYLVENSPEEIRDLVVEMDDLLNNSWVKKNQLIQEESNMNFIKNLSNFHHTNENSQNKKWKYPSQGSSPDSIIHGSIKSLFSRKFLEKNSFFID